MTHKDSSPIRGAVALISRLNSDGETEYLMVCPLHESGEYPGHYLVPGGHIEPDETATMTIVRELQEELGIAIEPLHELATTHGDVDSIVIEWWAARVIGDEAMKLKEDELCDAAYFTKEQLQTLPLWPTTQRFLSDYLQ